MVGVEFWGLSLAEIVIAFAAAAWAIDRLLDVSGKSASSKRLREENGDLVRYNNELEASVKRGETDLIEARQRISVLETRVAELEVRDQKAVLERLDRHEVMAEKRYENTKDGDERRHAETLPVLKNIAEMQKAIVQSLSDLAKGGSDAVA